MYERAKCRLKVDVAIAVGFSSEIGYSFSKAYMKELAERLNISPSSSQISVIQFGKTTNLKIKFSSVGDFSSTVDGLKFPGAGRSINKALRTAYDQSFSGMRNEAEQVLLLVTDVLPSKPTDLKATLKLYKEAGIKVMILSKNKLPVPSDLLGNAVEMVVLRSIDMLTSEEILDRTTNTICHAAGMESVTL